MEGEDEEEFEGGMLVVSMACFVVKERKGI